MKKNHIGMILALLLIFSMTMIAIADLNTTDANYEGFIDDKKEGMTAGEMLEKATEELLALETMKYTLDMNMKSHVIEKAEEGLKEADMTIKMFQEGAIDLQNDKVHVISTSKAMTVEEEIDTVTELFMDNYTMYMKFPGAGKWFKNDINPIRQELQGLLGRNIENNAGISKQQMALFGRRATYLPDERMNEEDYYVILLTVDQEAFKAAADEMTKATMEITTQAIDLEVTSSSQQEELQEEIGAMIKELMHNMNMDIAYTYYIDKDSKTLEKMDVVQRMYMMSGIVEIHTTNTGSFNYYAFDEEISFPSIPPEDITEGFMVQ
ncbi:hypothetical protein [Clostridium formicaceticum]|uniref:Uncharacterized protein n=1 Tax=Clostridium formicaceticum TaxID=1497 RepID=A0AAC9RFL6_9CLOT|nr:hypothetical protein [Clostridium formicaceticum]AOY75487.1 hypothetical protein BJL90_05995 [Clostridium formicaceticum]ARE85774.1 hypothetical protein CLFO_00900 [Clostridium formicaceticum]